MGVKKQFVLEENICSILDNAVQISKISNSDLVNKSLKLYLEIFFENNGKHRTDLGHEIQKIAFYGGKQWKDTVFSGFSGINVEEEPSNAESISEEEVIKRACILFARLYQERLVTQIEKKADELQRSPFKTICQMIKQSLEK